MTRDTDQLVHAVNAALESLLEKEEAAADLLSALGRELLRLAEFLQTSGGADHLAPTLERIQTIVSQQADGRTRAEEPASQER